MLPHTGLDVVRTESDGTEQALPELRWDWFRASVTNAEPGFTLSISKSDNQGQGKGHRDRQKARERTKLKNLLEGLQETNNSTWRDSN